MGIAKNVKSGKVNSGKSIIKLSEKERQILLHLKQNPEGLRVSSIQKYTQLPSRTVYNILEKFEEKKLLINQYPVWKKINGLSNFWQTLSNSNDIFELHDLSYVVKLIKVPDWWYKRKSKLTRLKDWQFSNHNFGKSYSNPYQQIMNEDYVIQTYKESIIIIHRKRQYSQDPFQVIIEGTTKTLELLDYLKERFRFDFFPTGLESIEIRSNHFNRIDDLMAKKCRQEGKRFLLETPKGKVWVDFSQPFGKEADTPDIQETLERVTEDHIMNKPMLNSELQAMAKQTLEMIQGLTKDNAALRLEINNLKLNLPQVPKETTGGLLDLGFRDYIR